MKVILKEAGKAPVVKEVEGKYRSDVKIVMEKGIMKEYVTIIPNEISLVVDEDGMSKDLPFNFLLSTNSFHYPIQAILGTVVFCRYQWENPLEKELYDYELRDLTEEDIIKISQLFDMELQKSLLEEFLILNEK